VFCILCTLDDGLDLAMHVLACLRAQITEN
jgi:hypothetical protein